MTANVVRHILLTLQQTTTEAEAQELLEQLADPWTRMYARKKWRELQARQVQQIGDDAS